MDKREKIIDAAMIAFQEKGVEKTTITDIVKRAGIAQGTYYLYFPSKLSVMPGIAEVFVTKILTRLQTQVVGESFDQQLTEVVESIFHITDENKDLAILIYSGLTQSEHLQEWESIYTPLYDWLENLLKSAKAAGSIRPEIKEAFTARIMVGAIESTAEQIYLYNQEGFAHARAHKKELLTFIKQALRAGE
ncbi:transcriptional regulator, TetR family [Bacillus sp. JCM 19046]|uniref:AcrR family transcriptional regulator n=1 Tax=Shouchella xiaoxiensis TaxID=766895 RepID=A0ABS2SUN4_9BACI|nr:TetR family transcriptional regulator [Shouchella xiaoxiensis]MBM7839245.1 AcrR family transcriptional regulator [Shouchella xiaoxiensis]GAF13064.1 transcriptional regulator, TetR family [Bacillus sp. JCM 19045]GAF15716.1 transcriptional regulator, TetR family [Bacillus sp. JCM 19046]